MPAVTARPATPAMTAPPVTMGSLAPLRADWSARATGARLVTAVTEARPLRADVTMSPGTRAIALATLIAADPSSTVLAVTATTREAEDLAAALRELVDPDVVDIFPSWETLPHERLSPRSDTVGRRLAVLRRLTHPDPDDAAYGPLQVVVAPIRACLLYTSPSPRD